MRADRSLLSVAIVLSITLSLSVGCADPVTEETHERSRQIPQWFDEAKLGVFIHWGPASVPAFAATAALAAEAAGLPLEVFGAPHNLQAMNCKSTSTLW